LPNEKLPEEKLPEEKNSDEKTTEELFESQLQIIEKNSTESSSLENQEAIDLKAPQAEIILPQNEQIIPSSNVEEISKKQPLSFQVLWREGQIKIAEKEKAKREELKERNRETNLMFHEEEFKKNADETEKKQSKDALNRIFQKSLTEKNKEEEQKQIDIKNAAEENEEEILREAIEKAEIQREESKKFMRQQVLDLNEFLNKIFEDLNLEREAKVNLEVPNFEEVQQNLLGTSLIVAVSSNKILVVEKILNHHSKEQFINFKYGNKKANSLNIACDFGFFEIAKLLIEKGIDVKDYDSEKNGALHICAEKKDQKFSQESGLQKTVQSSEIAKMIISKCYDDWGFLSAKNSNSLSALEICCKTSGNWSVLKNILETSAYKNNSDEMTIPYLKSLTFKYQNHPENTNKTLNIAVFKLLETLEAVSSRQAKNFTEEVPSPTFKTTDKAKLSSNDEKNKFALKN
jgi:ankyrin repeat protein